MMTLLAFLFAVTLLVAVHEYGHYRMAIACGVKVLRFSVGFGKPVLRWIPAGSSTEFVVCALPFGGYVRMLDGREGPVAPQERHQSFDTRPLAQRALIVAAGPSANLFLAVVLYAVVNWWGIAGQAPVLAAPEPDSIAARAGLVGGETVEGIFQGDASYQSIKSFEELRWALMRSALEPDNVRLRVTNDGSLSAKEIELPLRQIGIVDADGNLMRRIGIVAPMTLPTLGEITSGGAADRAGLRAGDRVLRVDAWEVKDGSQLRRIIRSAAEGGQTREQTWLVSRGGQEIFLSVRPDLYRDAEGQWGRVGAYVGVPMGMVFIRYGMAEGAWRAVVHTWEVSALTLSTIGRMLTGEASLKNLSGPLTVADFAGRSADLGPLQYLLFLALISVSLGVLNLLPLPVLDGGHLMYYGWEAVTGRPIPIVWLDWLQKAGLALLLLMTTLALFNDLGRLWG